MDPDLALILDAFARSAAYYRSGARLFAVGALVALLGAALLSSDPPRALSAAVLAALFGAIALGSRALVRRYTEESGSPVLHALKHAPTRIALAAPRTIPANPMGLGLVGREQHLVSIKLSDGSALGVRADASEIPRLLDALARLSPTADINRR